MSAADYPDIIRRYCAAFERGDIDALDDLVHPNVIDHGAYDDQNAGIEGYREFFTLWSTAFPDLEIELELTICEYDFVAYRWRARGTHLGMFHDHPPTGRPVRFSAISINRIRGGLIVEEWVEIDQLGLMRQLGIAE